MNILRPHFLLLFIFTISSCKNDLELTVDSFTPVDQIDPNIYFATLENIKNDPSDKLMSFFREKKSEDMANPEKPRPFPSDAIGQIENRSSEKPWTPIHEIFTDSENNSNSELDALQDVILTRIVFNNEDLKVIELAIASGGVLPFHAEATPSVYHVLGGSGDVTSGDSTALVHTGTSIAFDSYTGKKVEVTSSKPMKILWFRWAPEGDKSYLESGYYLTGCNSHIQPIEAVFPENLSFWEEDISIPFEKTEKENFISAERTKSSAIRDSKKYYPNTAKFKSESEVQWVDVVNLDPKSFFFANDLKSLGSVLDLMATMAKIKSVFRVKRPDQGYDLNYSYLAWGPQSKYITHSHAICEFYYLLDGDVEYIINGVEYHATPGNFYFHPPYYDHEMRGLKKDVPFLSISGSWIPFGKRELFEKPFIWLEDVPDQEVTIPNDFDFHDFSMKRGLKYGILPQS